MGSARWGGGAKNVRKGGIPLVVGIGIAARTLLGSCPMVVLVVGHAGCWMEKNGGILAAE